jgi:predicted alpha/beta-fold hydrolase
MPLIKTTNYRKRPWYMLNAHWETIIPSIFFKVKEEFYTRERIELNDGDFLDLDWIKNGNTKCLVITHGLEGGSDRYYVKRTAKYFSALGWDILAWNCRSCSGEMNRLPRFYHHGDTDDLNTVVKTSLDQGYNQVALMGYSMGGSMSLKYLGEDTRDHRIVGGAFFSVPCNLRDSAVQLKLPENQKYQRRFLDKLLDKVNIKSIQFPEFKAILEAGVEDFDDFHEKFTAPLHGFKNKEDFFDGATCDQFLDEIKVPVLIVNALNDPMLGDACYPFEIAQASDHVFFETPEKGGHTGFTLSGKEHSYMEVRADQFFQEHGIY